MTLKINDIEPHKKIYTNKYTNNFSRWGGAEFSFRAALTKTKPVVAPAGKIPAWRPVGYMAPKRAAAVHAAAQHHLF
jgi:hypothetical protein